MSTKGSSSAASSASREPTPIQHTFDPEQSTFSNVKNGVTTSGKSRDNKSHKKRKDGKMSSSEKVTVVRNSENLTLPGHGSLNSESIVTNDGPSTASGSNSGSNGMPDKEELEKRFAKSKCVNFFRAFCFPFSSSEDDELHLFLIIFLLAMSSSHSWPSLKNSPSWLNEWAKVIALHPLRVIVYLLFIHILTMGENPESVKEGWILLIH